MAALGATLGGGVREGVEDVHPPSSCLQEPYVPLAPSLSLKGQVELGLCPLPLAVCPQRDVMSGLSHFP